MNSKPIHHPGSPFCDHLLLPFILSAMKLRQAAILPPPTLPVQLQSRVHVPLSKALIVIHKKHHTYENLVHTTPVTNAELQVLGGGYPQAHKVGPSHPAGDQNCFQVPGTVQDYVLIIKGCGGLVARVRYYQSGFPNPICNHKLTRYHITQLLYSFATATECQAQYGLWDTGLELGLLSESSAVILSCSFPLTWIFCEQESAFTASFAPLPLTVCVALAKSHSLAQFFHLDTWDNCKARFPNKVFQNSQVNALWNCKTP